MKPQTHASSRAIVPSSRSTAAVVRRGQVQPVTSGSRSLRPRQYGDIVDSDEVHPEIEALGKQARRVIQENLQPTTEAQVLVGVKRFGPSKASRRILNKENDAAKLAYETGLYILWRCMETPALSGANRDFCARLGSAHRCFCQHTLADHAPPTPDPARGTARRTPPPRMRCGVEGCACAGFHYIPNTPEEIGEGWLSRRANWNPAQWSPKCRCSHGSKEHDPALRHACRRCGCGGFESHCLCVVCDRPMEAHATVVESESERRAAGLPVGAAFFPLSGIDWEVRELVLKDPTGGGVLMPPTSRPVLTDTAPATATTPSRASTAAALPMDLEPYCRSCGTTFKTAESRFCRKCGLARQA